MPANSTRPSFPGTESWLDINNNRVFLAGDISVTANGVSLYYSAKNDPKMADLAKDIRSTVLPIGPVGQPVELHQTTSAVIFQLHEVSRMRRRPICSSCSTSRRWTPGSRVRAPIAARR